jgi:hypothetical protein
LDRHGRQIRLAEVGSTGQKRILEATVDVAVGGLAAEVAARYLAGAGVGCIRVRSTALAAAATAVDPAVRVEVDSGSGHEDVGVHPESHDFRDPVAREVAEGARAALRAIRAVLEGNS